jgi:hypothetical protein
VLKIRYIAVVPSWLGKYNNCLLLLNAFLTQNDEFSFIKVQDVVTNRSAVYFRIRRMGQVGVDDELLVKSDY